MLDGQGDSTDQVSLVQARARIAAQDREIQQLRQQVATNRFAEGLRQSLIQAGAAATITAPPAHAQLLTLILEAAANTINSTSASILTVDESRQELVIEHALGPSADKAIGLRVPLGHGIAGLVAATGQPMAISNAREDPRHAAEIAEAIGYRPSTIVCVPLLVDEQVLGVLELMDKAGGKSFTAEDIEMLSLFSAQAAIVIEQSRTYASLSSLIGQVLSAPDQAGGEGTGVNLGAAFATAVQETTDFHETLELARLVQQVAGQGELERQLCASLLQTLLTYFGGRVRAGISGPGR